MLKTQKNAKNAKNLKYAKNAYEFDQKKSMRYFVVQTISNNLHHKFFWCKLLDFENAKNSQNEKNAKNAKNSKNAKKVFCVLTQRLI